MNTIPRWLSEYGLNTTQIKVYLSILQHPKTKVSDIQRRTGLVRTSIYYALGQLKADGLIFENLQNNVKTYRAADLSNLERNIEGAIADQQQKLDALGSLAPLFARLQATPADNESFVSRYEGVKAIKQALEEAFRCESKQWCVIASRDNFLYHMSKQYQRYYLDERKRRGIVSKTLWEPVDSFDVAKIDDSSRNPRHLPAQFRGAFKALIILYDDTTLIIDPYNQKTAHAIHNATSTQVMRLMFEAIWDTAAAH